MKILIVNSLYYPNEKGGAEKSVRFLAERLKHNYSNYDVSILTTDNYSHNEYFNGVNIYSLKIKNLYNVKEAKNQQKIKKIIWHILNSFNILNYFKIARKIDEINPDIIHTNNIGGISSIIWLIAHFKKIPLIHTIRDHSLLCIKTTMFKKGRNCSQQCFTCKLINIFNKKLSVNVNAVVGISRYILDKHINHNYFPKSLYKVIPNSLPNYYHLESKHNKKIKKSEILTCGYIGTIYEGKGIEFLIDTFAELKNENIQLLIYGEAQNEHYLEIIKTKAKNSKIYFKGYQNIDKIFKSVDILIAPSLLNEAFGRTIIEAYSYGIPVIGTKRGGIPELIKEGITGYTFEPTNKEDLQSTILKFFENEKISNLSANCIEEAHKYIPSNVTRQYSDLYTKILNNELSSTRDT